MKHVCDVPSDQTFYMKNTSSNESYVVHYVPGKWLPIVLYIYMYHKYAQDVFICTNYRYNCYFCVANFKRNFSSHIPDDTPLSQQNLN